MEWIRLMGLCLLAAAIVVIIRQMNPAIAGLICAAFGVMVLGTLLPQIREYVESIRSFLDGVGISGEYYAIMLKAMGIVLITQIAVQVCMDMDVPAVAVRVEFCGRLALMGVAVPVFIELTQMAVGILL